MVDASDLRRHAMALPEAYEDVHRRRPAFRVNGKIFAMLGVTGVAGLFERLADDAVAVIKLDRNDQLNFAADMPNAVQETEIYGHHGWTYVRLTGLDDASLETLIRLAWLHVAPKRLLKTSTHP